MIQTMFQDISITESLGIRGWKHVDSVLLAALATESPLLLIGPHGTAKSMLVERVARALQQRMRHYNASLINYDDLVGIPLPDEHGTSLKFITGPGTIWDTSFVFFDEISRCRADLQNKLFPIIHERRVIGIDLTSLRHRWAAMNPPMPDAPVSAGQEYYGGSESLDFALLDRFPFIIPVPNWADLTREDRIRVIIGNYDEESRPSETLFDLSELVEACAELIPQVERESRNWLGEYVVSLVDFLEQANLRQSPRRAAMIARSITAVHAARMVLEGVALDDPQALDESVEIAVRFSLPQTGTDTPPSPMKVIALHRQAWEIAQRMEDSQWRQVMLEFDKARRVALADTLNFSDDDMSQLITQALGAEDSDARQIGLATAIFLAFQTRRQLAPSAFEPLAQLASHVLAPTVTRVAVNAGSPEADLWDQITGWLDYNRKDSLLYRLKRNYLLQGFPNLWRTEKWQDALETFSQDLLLFGVEEN